MWWCWIVDVKCYGYVLWQINLLLLLLLLQPGSLSSDFIDREFRETASALSLSHAVVRSGEHRNPGFNKIDKLMRWVLPSYVTERHATYRQRLHYPIRVSTNALYDIRPIQLLPPFIRSAPPGFCSRRGRRTPADLEMHWRWPMPYSFTHEQWTMNKTLEMLGRCEVELMPEMIYFAMILKQ